MLSFFVYLWWCATSFWVLAICFTNSLLGWPSEISVAPNCCAFSGIYAICSKICSDLWNWWSLRKPFFFSCVTMLPLEQHNLYFVHCWLKKILLVMYTSTLNGKHVLLVVFNLMYGRECKIVGTTPRALNNCHRSWWGRVCSGGRGVWCSSLVDIRSTILGFAVVQKLNLPNKDWGDAPNLCRNWNITIHLSLPYFTPDQVFSSFQTSSPPFLSTTLMKLPPFTAPKNHSPEALLLWWL